MARTVIKAVLNCLLFFYRETPEKETAEKLIEQALDLLK